MGKILVACHTVCCTGFPPSVPDHLRVCSLELVEASDKAIEMSYWISIYFLRLCYFRTFAWRFIMLGDNCRKPIFSLNIIACLIVGACFQTGNACKAISILRPDCLHSSCRLRSHIKRNSLFNRLEQTEIGAGFFKGISHVRKLYFKYIYKRKCRLRCVSGDNTSESY